MKEIDFLPQWYERGKRRRKSYHRQYVEVTFLFFALVLWSFIGGDFLSEAQARLQHSHDFLTANAPFNAEYRRLQAECEQLQQKADILEKLDTKIDVSNILGELSFLISDDIILKKLDIRPQSFNLRVAGARRSNVRLGSAQNGGETALPQMPLRFEVVISGIGVAPAAVAQLISRLESSTYFLRVIPGLMQNKETKGYQITEFEISCYLANYVEKQKVNSQ